MNVTKYKTRDRFLVFSSILFVLACILQLLDNYIDNWNLSRFIALLAQYIFLGILAYWTVSVISRVSDKNIRLGLATTIILMSLVLILKLIKYNVAYNKNAERYLWYAYYIPQCLAPVVLFLTVLDMDKKDNKNLSKWWYLLFIPSIFLIFLVFTNDFHEQVFSFKEGVINGSKIYKWEWGYYLILCWIAILYLINGILLFIKCRISKCRKKAFIPLLLFILCLSCCILREIFNPKFIKMPETVVFSVVIVCESLIQIGFIPSNTDYENFFDMADVSAIITDKDLNIKMASKNAYDITLKQAYEAIKYKEIAISKDLTLKTKPLTGGKLFWIEDSFAINKINNNLQEINNALAEEIDLITAENRLKEQRVKIEEQKKLYANIFDIVKPCLEKIKQLFSKAITTKKMDKALRLATFYGVYLKRRSNLTLIKKDNKISLLELIFSLQESIDALLFCNIQSSLVYENDNGMFDASIIEFIYDFFEYVIENSLIDLSYCLVKLNNDAKELSFRIILDNINTLIDKNYLQEKCLKYQAKLSTIISDDTLFITITFKKKVMEIC